MNVLVETVGPVATVTLNRPDKRNALTLAMLRSVGAAFETLGEDDTVRVVVLRGAGAAFCVGADVLEFVQHDANSARRTWIAVGHRVTSVIAQLPQPTVAVLQGHAVGGGLELALACDFRVAAASVRLGLPEVSIGTLPGWGGSARLAATIGPARAKEMVLLAETVDGSRAAELGLASQTVAPDALDTAADALIRKLVDQPAVAVQLAKQVMSTSIAGSHQVMTFEALAGALSVGTEDLHEGVRAFREKRTPQFKGR